MQEETGEGERQRGRPISPDQSPSLQQSGFRSVRNRPANQSKGMVKHKKFLQEYINWIYGIEVTAGI